MALNEGYIFLHRQMLNWGWYKNTNTKALFLHCLLKANHIQAVFENEIIDRGEFVTSLSHLAEETGLSVKQVRVSLNHLKGTKEVASRSNSKYTVITIVNYDSYQPNGAKDGASEGQAKGKQRASEGQQYNNNNNNNNIKKERKKKEKNSSDFPSFTPSDTDYDKIEIIQGKIGGGVVRLSQKQFDTLLNMLSIDEFNYYIGVVRDAELNGKHYKKPHFQAILEMVDYDRNSKVR